MFGRQTKQKLKIWEEATGLLQGSSINKNNVTITLITQKVLHINFPRGSDEAKIILGATKKLQKKKITILRTDIPQKPLIIRVLDNTENLSSKNGNNPNRHYKSKLFNTTDLKKHWFHTIEPRQSPTTRSQLAKKESN
ncbi:MAG: hypothetical protein QXU99_08030 [Candidatus Bathyarchaeia archaeon]